MAPLIMDALLWREGVRGAWREGGEWRVYVSGGRLMAAAAAVGLLLLTGRPYLVEFGERLLEGHLLEGDESVDDEIACVFVCSRREGMSAGGYGSAAVLLQCSLCFRC